MIKKNAAFSTLKDEEAINNKCNELINRVDDKWEQFRTQFELFLSYTKRLPLQGKLKKAIKQMEATYQLFDGDGGEVIRLWDELQAQPKEIIKEVPAKDTSK